VWFVILLNLCFCCFGVVVCVLYYYILRNYYEWVGFGKEGERMGWF
jgi:hypothetical protein